MTFESKSLPDVDGTDRGHSGRNRRTGPRAGVSLRPGRAARGDRLPQRRAGGRPPQPRLAALPGVVGDGPGRPTPTARRASPTWSSWRCRGRGTRKRWPRRARAAGRQDRGGLREPARLRQARAVSRCGCPRAARPSRPSRCCRSRGCCAAFHHVSASLLADPAVDRIDLDVLVLGDDRDAVGDRCIALAGRIDGMRGIYAGRLRNAGQVEAFTANLIAINSRYKAPRRHPHHRSAERDAWSSNAASGAAAGRSARSWRPVPERIAAS